MKKNYTLLITLITLSLALVTYTVDISALNGSISITGPTSLSPGETGTYRISYTSPVKTTFFFTVGATSNGSGSVTVSNPGSDNSGALSGAIEELKITAGSAGVPMTIGIISQENYTVETFETVNLSGGLTVNIVNPTPDPPTNPNPPVTPDPPANPDPEPEDPKSSNYYLSSLTVSPGTLSPAFSSRTDVYTVTLPDDATTFSVNGTVEDSSATITQGVGTFNVQPTSFLHKVIVQAENGALWAYDINFVVNDDRSDNSKLQSLNVSSGTLSPNFNPDTYEYEVELNPNVSSVNVTATKQDDAATIIGTGTVDIVEGETNRAEVVVTAENGTTSTYTIYFTVLEIPPQTIDYNGQELTFETELPEELEKLGFTLKSDLEGFEEGTPYYQNEDGSLTAIYLNDGDDSNWYLLNDQQEIIGILLVLEVDNKTYGYIEIDEELREQPQMSYQTLTLADQEISGWVYDDPELSDFQMFYLLNQEGQQDFYHFHSEQDGLMRVGPFRFSNQVQQEADQEEAPEEVETSGMSDKEFESLLFLIISLLSIVALVGVVLLIRNRQSKREKL